MPRPKLDRLVSFDPQSRDFPIRSLLEAGGATTPRSFTWACQPHLNQLNEGACVGFYCGHELAGRPVEVAGITDAYARQIYLDAQKVDEWPGEAYEGTSVLAGAKVMKARGLIGEYRWAFGLQDVILTVGYQGPVGLGINWYDEMFEPDTGGVVHVGGAVAGGHAILCNGVSVKHKLFRLHNSWGIDWGVFGDCFISWADVDRLLKEDGEALVPLHRAKTPGSFSQFIPALKAVDDFQQAPRGGIQYI